MLHASFYVLAVFYNYFLWARLLISLVSGSLMSYHAPMLIKIPGSKDRKNRLLFVSKALTTSCKDRFKTLKQHQNTTGVGLDLVTILNGN